MTKSLRGKYYKFVIVDDYSKFTWKIFLSSNEDTFVTFVGYVKLI